MELKLHDQEVILQNLWKSRKLFDENLTTFTGKKVEILYAGSHNNDTGPDFKDAVIKIGSELVEGDVEVHLNPAGWYDHKHHIDPAYNGVILHIVSEKKQHPERVEKENGVQVEQVQVELDKETIAAWKKQQGAPENTENNPKLITNCPLVQQDREKITATVNAAGEIRFQDKVSQLQEDLLLDTWNQVIYKKMLEALGYSKNRKPFRKLAELIPFETLSAEMQWVKEEMAEMRCSALLFGAAGLLPVSHKSREKLDVGALRYVTPLLDLWEGMSRRLDIKTMKAHEWQFFRLRPQNFPTRRLAGFVGVMMKVYKHGLLETFLRVVNGNINHLKRLSSELELHLKQKAEGFWKNRFHFETPVKESPGSQKSLLIGKDRARDILVNNLLPALYLYGHESNAGKLQNAALELYRGYPRLADNTITKLMSKQLSGKNNNKFRARFACQQQGLLQLHKIYCRNLQCESCLQLNEV